MYFVRQFCSTWNLFRSLDGADGKTANKSETVTFRYHNVCCFCNKEEDIQHLFFECSYTKKIWSDILGWLKLQHMPMSLEQEIVWLKMTLAMTIYEIWHHRNNIIFSGCSIESNIVDNIIFIVKIRCSGIKKLNINLMCIIN